MRLNRDAMNNANPKIVAMASLKVLMGIEDERPHTQIMAAAAVFLALAEHLDIPPQEVFTAIKNLIVTTEGKRTEFAAIDAYMQGEWNA
ncbi:hypothetical protein [Neorhizobium sp. S3-V5DH]|uniref:hypothetical protein n=1 Tax=Neorhizobium sp. S3-V5DH TaxID=2485166 RepID=UPI0010430780|nr:hypothetical protein [Neorhizobium sp. S3-V5DH]TCV62333.1 hypothetical protein EDE09_12498 [Neorhizobium sp. S3-V5DH]